MTVSGILKHLHAPPLLPARGEGEGGVKISENLCSGRRGGWLEIFILVWGDVIGGGWGHVILK